MIPKAKICYEVYKRLHVHPVTYGGFKVYYRDLSNFSTNEDPIVAFIEGLLCYFAETRNNSLRDFKFIEDTFKIEIMEAFRHETDKSYYTDSSVSYNFRCETMFDGKRIIIGNYNFDAEFHMDGLITGISSNLKIKYDTIQVGNKRAR